MAKEKAENDKKNEEVLNEQKNKKTFVKWVQGQEKKKKKKKRREYQKKKFYKKRKGMM
jgi:hypothetical protein